MVLAGCPASATPTPSEAAEGSPSPDEAAASQAPAAGTVSGRVTYADGRPLEGAHVAVIGVDFLTRLELQTDADGAYQGVVGDPDANYRMAAWFDARFEGETFHFPLEPVGDPDTHFFGADGFTKDFVWQLTGKGSWANELDPDDPRDRIGGSLTLYVYDPNNDPSGERALELPAGSTVDVSLEPLTPLVDGTEAEPITGTITIEEETRRFNIVGVLSDIPLARYELSATVTEPGGSPQPLLVGMTCTASGCPIRPPPLADTAELSFTPEDSSVHENPFQGRPVAGTALYVTQP